MEGTIRVWTFHGEVIRFGKAGHVGCVANAHVDGQASVIATAPKVGGGFQCGTAGTQPSDEGVCGATAESGLEGTRRVNTCHGEVIRLGKAGHVCAPAGTHGDGQASVIAATPEVGGIDQDGAGRAQLGDEGVFATGQIELEGTQWARTRRGEIGGHGKTGDVDVAGGVHGNAQASLIAATPEIGGKAQHWIDDERLTRIVGGHFKTHLILALEHVAAHDGVFDAARFLIDPRSVKEKFAAVQVQDEVALLG